MELGLKVLLLIYLKIFKIFDHGGAIGDIDNDGDIDIVLTDLERVLRCLINDGTGKMKIKKCGSINAFGIELGDFDNDGDLDIVHAGHEYSGTITGIALIMVRVILRKK